MVLPAQEVPLYLEQRYDEVVLTGEYDQARLQVFPLPFAPDDIPRQEKVSLRLRLIDYPDREYDVAWNNIDRVDFFEDVLIADATRLINEGEFEQAYDALRFVWKGAPEWRGLKEAINRLLMAEAGAAYRDNRDEEAIVLLDELFRRQPDTRVANALMRVVDRAFGQRIQAQDFRGARQIIAWVDGRPQLRQAEKVAAWRQQLRELADGQLRLAGQAAGNRDYREAYVRVDAALRILPDDPAARQLVASLLKEYTRVAVAVSSLAATQRTEYQDWASGRVARLTDRHLLELVGQGPDGGQYGSAYGALEYDADNCGLRLKLPEQQRNTVLRDAWRQTLEEATDTRRRTANPYLARLLKSWELRQEEFHVRAADNTLRWLPLLDVPLAMPLPSWQPFVRDQLQGPVDVYLANKQGVYATAGQVVEINERRFASQDDMIAAIESGDVDVVDRLLPAEADQVSSQDIQVGRYGLISMYFLVPNDRSSLGRNRAFRRGVVRAIPRENLLSLILSGRTFDGCDVLSGPFHQGFDRSDPLAYANNIKIAPRPFDPALGATLISMSWHLAEMEAADARNAAADRTSQSEGVDKPASAGESTERVTPEVGEANVASPQNQQNSPRTIVLVHADDAILTSMADQISRSLRIAGIRCQARRLPREIARPPDDDTWHLWLADVAAREPIIDIFQMFSPRGLVPRPSAYVQQALNELSEVTRWSDARVILNQIHELVHRELSVIPLWQLTNHYAYRSRWRGLGANIMTLYQNVETWTLMK